MTTGSVEVVRTDGGWEVRLGADFNFDGAPLKFSANTAVNITNEGATGAVVYATCGYTVRS